jgi:hypothetical protein
LRLLLPKLPALLLRSGRGALLRLVPCACAGGEFLDQLTGFDGEIGHGVLLFGVSFKKIENKFTKIDLFG